MSKEDRASLLFDAEEAVNQDRNETYDEPTIDLNRIAGAWSWYLDARNHEYLDGHDVAAMMVLLKLSRTVGSPEHRDSWLDVAGWAACGWDCAHADEEVREWIRKALGDPVTTDLDHMTVPTPDEAARKVTDDRPVWEDYSGEPNPFYG